MSESATEVPSNEDEWHAAMEAAAAEVEEIDEDVTDDDAATSEAEPEPDLPEEEGDDPTPPEGDSEAEQEGPEDDAEDAPEEEDPEAEAGEPEPEEELPEDDAEPQPEGTLEEPDPDQADAPEELEWEPWVGKADGTEIRMPGAQVSEAGLFVPADQIPKLQEYLADRSVHYRTVNQLQAQLSEKSGAIEEAETIVAHFTNLLKDGDAAWEWFQNLETNGPALLADAKAKGLEARNRQYEEREAQRRFEEDEAQFERERPERLRGVVERALTLDEFADLDVDPAEFAAALDAEYGAQLWSIAGEGGVKLGDTEIPQGVRYLNPEAFTRAVQAEARVARARAEAAAATAAAKSRNRKARRGKRKNAAPPAVRSQGTPVPSGDEEAAPPTSREEWEKQLERERAAVENL